MASVSISCPSCSATDGVVRIISCEVVIHDFKALFKRVFWL
ncbi:hypothetical protein FHA58_06475 [Escherichia coli]|nr:hypothetical protein [Escherichia coli]